MGIVGEDEHENKNQKVILKEEERWLKHYASFHEILLVGDGDFSFSLCLAKSFGSASNIVATSLDTYDMVIRKYKNAKSNIEMLKELGAYVLHGVDATKMKLHTDLQMRKFDRIIFNFPHAGFHGKEGDPRLIAKHKGLLCGFFRNSSSMLRANGEVHVSHKTTHPFCCWDLGGLAAKNFLLLTECVDFKIEDYPGYNNKRGASFNCDQPFPLGESSTFKFRFNKAAWKMGRLDSHNSVHEGRQKSLKIFTDSQWQPNLLNMQCSSRSITFQNVTSGNPVLPVHANTRKECFGNGLNSMGSNHEVSQKSQVIFADSQRQPMLPSRRPLSDITFQNVTSGNRVLPMHANTRNECFGIRLNSMGSIHEVSHKSQVIFADSQGQPMLRSRRPLSDITLQNVTLANHGLPMHTNTRNECFGTCLNSMGSIHEVSHKSQVIFADSQQQPMPSLSDITFQNVSQGNHALPVHANLRDECFSIFGWHLDRVVETFGRTDSDVSHHVREALRVGFEGYTAEGHGRPSHDYLNILEELHHMSTLRSAWLRNLLRQSDEAVLSRQKSRVSYPFLNHT